MRCRVCLSYLTLSWATYHYDERGGVPGGVLMMSRAT